MLVWQPHTRRAGISLPYSYLLGWDEKNRFNVFFELCAFGAARMPTRKVLIPSPGSSRTIPLSRILRFRPGYRARGAQRSEFLRRGRGRDAGELCAFGAAPARGPTRWTRHRDHGPAIVSLGFCSFGLFAPRSAGTGGGPRGSGGDASVQARRCKKKTTNRRSEVPTGSAVVLLTKTCVGLVVLRRTDEHCGAR